MVKIFEITVPMSSGLFFSIGQFYSNGVSEWRRTGGPPSEVATGQWRWHNETIEEKFGFITDWHTSVKEATDAYKTYISTLCIGDGYEGNTRVYTSR